MLHHRTNAELELVEDESLVRFFLLFFDADCLVDQQEFLQTLMVRWCVVFG